MLLYEDGDRDMEISCGTDIIEIHRVKEAIQKESFIKKVYTLKEQEYCNKKATKEQHYAGRFAAKEAVLKAVSKRISTYEITWQDIEILNNKDGRPKVVLNKEITDLENIDISISHCKEYATAIAVATFKK